jgi:phosphatidylglycerol---prolipoprotein diacylglyceryl transferase
MTQERLHLLVRYGRLSSHSAIQFLLKFVYSRKAILQGELLHVTFSIDPRVFGSPLMTWAGLVTVLIVLSIVALLLFKAPTLGISRTRAYGLSVAAVVCGLAAARMVHVLDFAGYYFAVPFQIAYIWNGGFAAWGAILGPLAVLWWQVRRTIPVPDALWALVLPFGIAALSVVRLTDFLSGQRQGHPTSLPWGVVYGHPSSEAYQLSVAQHPVALYEFLWLSAIAILVVVVASGPGHRGPLLNKAPVLSGSQRLIMALGLYALGRFIVGFSTAGEVHLGLLQSQWIALAVLGGISYWVLRAWRQQIKHEERGVERVPATSLTPTRSHSRPAQR